MCWTNLLLNIFYLNQAVASSWMLVKSHHSLVVHTSVYYKRLYINLFNQHVICTNKGQYADGYEYFYPLNWTAREREKKPHWILNRQNKLIKALAADGPRSTNVNIKEWDVQGSVYNVKKTIKTWVKTIIDWMPVSLFFVRLAKSTQTCSQPREVWLFISYVAVSSPV